MNYIQIIGLVLFTVGLVKLLYVRSVLRKGFRTIGRVAKNQPAKGSLTNHPRIEFEDKKGKKLVLTLKVSASFIQIHAKNGQIEIIHYEGRIFHPNELYSSMIIPAVGLILLLVGWYF